MNLPNNWLSYLAQAKHRVCRKLTDIDKMGHAKGYVLIDEHPDSLNFGDFAVAMNDGRDFD